MEYKLLRLLILFETLLSSIASIENWETFKSAFNDTRYSILCNEKYSECLKESLAYTDKYPIEININSNYTKPIVEFHSFMSQFFYQIGRIYYYGLIDKTPNLPLGLSNFIISAYFGNPSAQFKLYILLETNLYSQISSMPAFKKQLNYNPYLMSIQKTLFYKNFIFYTDESRSTRAMQFLYSSSLGQNLPAMMALGFKFLNGYGLTASCEISSKYYKEAAYQSIKIKSMSNTINYYNFVSLVKYEYLESKYKIQFDNIIERIDYYKLNAQKKDISSIQKLGQIFLLGYEGMQDYNKAFKWYQLGAELNDTQSIYHLGEMYLNGWGIESKDYDKAFQLFTKASNANFSLAWNSLGIMYYYGYGVERNPKRAYDYFKTAIKSNTTIQLEDVYFNLLTLLIEDKNDIAPNFAQAYKYANVIAITSHTYGMYFYAMMNQYNIGSMVNSCELNIEYFKQVAEKDLASKRLYDLAFITYQTGNYRIAALIYIELAEQGYELGQINAAIILKNYDIFIEKHFQQQLTFKYAKLASKSRNVHALLMLGDFYYDGYGDAVKQDYQKALNYYKKITNKASASNFLSAHAHFNIGLMYNLGKGVEKNITHAKNYYNIAKKLESTIKYPVFIMEYYNYYSEKNFTDIIRDKFNRIIGGFINSKIQMWLVLSFILFYCYVYISIKTQKG